MNTNMLGLHTLLLLMGGWVNLLRLVHGPTFRLNRTLIIKYTDPLCFPRLLTSLNSRYESIHLL